MVDLFLKVGTAKVAACSAALAPYWTILDRFLYFSSKTERQSFM